MNGNENGTPGRNPAQNNINQNEELLRRRREAALAAQRERELSGTRRVPGTSAQQGTPSPQGQPSAAGHQQTVRQPSAVDPAVHRTAPTTTVPTASSRVPRPDAQQTPRTRETVNRGVTPSGQMTRPGQRTAYPSANNASRAANVSRQSTAPQRPTAAQQGQQPAGQERRPMYQQSAPAVKRAPVSSPGSRPMPTQNLTADAPVKGAPTKNTCVLKPENDIRNDKETPDTAKDNEKKPKLSNTKAGADMMVSIVKAIVYMVIILVISVFISIFVIRVGNDVFAFVKSDEAIDITVPENATTDDIATILSDNGIINYPSIFKLYASLKHEKGEYIAGDYTVSPSMSYDQLRNEFKEHLATGTTWITIPEGFTTDEVIDLMVEHGIGERDKYIDVINNYDFDYWFIDELEASEKKEGRCYRLEGYLFPDTYEFYNSSSEEMVIRRMLDRFNEVFVEDYKTKAAELGYSVDEILTLASLIEKEAAGTSDYMKISSVFNNRLKNPWYYPKLESDATVVYGIQIETGVRPTELSAEDLSFESPYNTYLHEGLTPGPIANPSASAIRYALYPANTDYYFFVSADNGMTLYASSKPEHDANIQKVIKMNEDTE